MLATFAAGCFWGVEEFFYKLPGVIKTEVGYTGGNTENPSYEQVCRGDTGHAEAVRIEFDENVLSYEKLLEEFWHSHNPTTLNRQGPDHGTQYRSAIFFHDAHQKVLAEESKKQLEAIHYYQDTIVTEIVPSSIFYRAEEYHQQYFLKNGGGTCFF